MVTQAMNSSSNMESPYQRFKEMEDNKLMMQFKGEVTSEIIEMFLSSTEQKLEEQQIKTSVRKRIFNIMVECLQNLYHHTDRNLNLPEGGNSKNAMIQLYMNPDTYTIESGNYIRNENIEQLKTRIDRINAMSKEELRDFYREKMSEEKELESKGADLGMIDIARKSGDKIHYTFEKINDEISFFNMIVNIPKKKNK